jgi:putative proteasome-type protease
MTYCVGMLLDRGIVMVSDSRTNAGVDNISTFRKVTVFQKLKDRVFVLMTAGNLAASQAVVNLLREAIADPQEGQGNLFDVNTMFDAARCVGDAIRTVHGRDAESLKAFGLEFNVNCLLGGQIAGESPRLFNIYPAANFIEATADTSYFQVGEFKYGKPILDRVITRESSLEEAAKCALISMDSTIRSNLSVGLPIDLVLIRAGELRVGHHKVIDADDAYFRQIRNGWGEALRNAFKALPDPDLGVPAEP